MMPTPQLAAVDLKAPGQPFPERDTGRTPDRIGHGIATRRLVLKL